MQVIRLNNTQWSELMAHAGVEGRRAAGEFACFANAWLKREFWRGWRYGAVIALLGAGVAVAIETGKVKAPVAKAAVMEPVPAHA